MNHGARVTKASYGRTLMSRTGACGRSRLATLLSLVAASGFGTGLVWVRVAHTGSEQYGFLVWNLLLAWVPFILALWIYEAYRRGRRGLGLFVLGGFWLLFLPNGPYIVTDLLHVGGIGGPPFWHEVDKIGGAPLWYDAAMVAVFACVGLTLGLCSLFLIQSVLLETAGPRVAWACVLAAIGLASVGMYIGRFLRLNSWDVFSEPMALLSPARAFVADPLATPRFLGVTVLFIASLTVLYVLLWNVAHIALLRLDARRMRQSR